MNSLKTRKTLVYFLLFLVFSMVFSLVIGPKPGDKAFKIPDYESASKKKSDLYSNWSVPALKKDDFLEESMTALVRLKPWGGKTGKTINAVKTKWRFCGVVLSESKYFALVEQDGKVKRYKTGDLFASGETLLEVGNDFIRVAGEDEELVFKLYD